MFTQKLYIFKLLTLSGDTIRTWEVLILCIIAGLIITPAVSAEEEYAVNSGKEITFVSDDKDYIVRPWTENSLDKGSSVFPVRLIQYIRQGQTITNNVKVGSRVEYLEVDLNWGDKSDSLALSIYTPPGRKLGTYRDNSDRNINGRIHFRIDPSYGCVDKGTWKFKVCGESVSGTEGYTFNIYQH